MELVYTNQLGGFEPGKRYRVPDLFRNVERDAVAVTVVGEYPQIVSAYESVGVDVRVVEAPASGDITIKQDPGFSHLVDKNEQLQAESNALRALIEAAEGEKPLEHPEAGELPIRLFDALLSIHNAVVDVTTERDGLRTKVDTLRDEVEALKKAAIASTTDEAGEIEALKAKLDEARVPYRANASKESLEKLVAELPKE
ncbi:hypothetical protein PSH77_15030 [Pseudomonas extremorientalis]|uniref:hypothetical protein n=1 Tax=Pseudomonas extremorientalis TaxID=169669 RepID=UPI002732EF5F|nr:hypothetical protein [Pseudomonas extremorientalis]WLG54012.1 hypothetical protein PSH77_15030 [Pseudomonas extremorientalis]